MKMNLKETISKYRNTWWIPLAVYLASLALFSVVSLPQFGRLNILSNTLFVFMLIALLGILSVALWHFIQRQWSKGFVNLGIFLLGGVAAVMAFGFLMFASLFGPSEDGFADNLIIPQNIEVNEPLTELEPEPGKEDVFQKSLLTALSSPGSDDPTVKATVTKLVTLQKNAPDILRRYLATSPSWRLFKEKDKIYATRRWLIGSEWLYTLHGYYTKHDIDTWSKFGTSNFQSRLTLGFSGSPWARVSTAISAPDESHPLALSLGNQMQESWCLIKADDIIVEIFEQSEAKERRLTKASLAYLEKEFTPLVASPTWETIRSVLPKGSISHGQSSFNLRRSFQPGIYDSIIWVNPGEPGMIYLKSFEVTKGTPLSVRTLKESSNEWIGWSNNPDQLFFSNTHFTIYEGDWGKPYAARFEVWFTPDSGKADRKLLEKVFKIEGWQR
jgi:hypothetical protein